jgi:predicted phosphoribosyltransferase
MARSDQAVRLGPYAQELLENEYVRENLREGVDKLQAAYRRARKRRVEPTRDERLRRQVRSAAESITEAGRALRSGRRKPERRWGTRILVIAGLGAAAGAAALWARERLSEQPATAVPPASAGDGVDRAREPTPA